MSKNGQGFVVKSRAPGLANYPHARKKVVLYSSQAFHQENQTTLHGKG
jgi:hypothetical protein